MPLRATVQRRFAKQCRSGSCVEVRLPFAHLMAQFQRLLAQRVVSQLSASSTPTGRQRIEDREPARKLDDFVAIDPAMVVIPITAHPDGRNVLAIANDFEDFATGDARCLHDEMADIETTLTDQFEGFWLEVRTRAESFELQDGPQAALSFFSHMQRLASDKLSALKRDDEHERRQHFSPANLDSYQKHAAQIRKLAPQPAWWLRLLVWLVPLICARWVFPKSQQARVDRLLRVVREAQGHRLEQVARLRIITLLERLVGTSEQSGLIAEHMETIREQSLVFDRLIEQWPEPAPFASASHVIVPVTSLSDPLGRRSNQTLGEVFFKTLASYGFTPAKLVQDLREHGLDCAGRIRLPHEWHAEDVAVVGRAFQQRVAEYLGADDQLRDIDINRPTRAIEYLARISFFDPAFEEIMPLVVSEIAKRTRSFAEQFDHSASKSTRHVYVLCHPSQRIAWEYRLSTRTTLSVTSNDSGLAKNFDLTNPHVMVLSVHETTLTGGLLRGFHEWMMQGNRARVESKVKPLHDRRLLPETRLLSRRETDLAYCHKLFENALAIGAIKPDGNSGRFLPTKPDARIDFLFERVEFEAVWQSADHFHELLKGTQRGPSLFSLVIEEQVPGQIGFRQQASDLASRFDSEEVAQSLVERGVLERNAAQQYRVTFKDATKVYGLTEFLFAPKSRKPTPLTRDEFIALLQRDDDLHDVLFFAVSDAVAFQLIVPNDVPAAVRDYIALTMKSV